MDEVSPFMEANSRGGNTYFSGYAIASALVVILILFLLYRFINYCICDDYDDNYVEKQVELLRERQQKNM